MRKTIGFALAALLVAGLTACGSSSDDDSSSSPSSEGTQRTTTTIVAEKGCPDQAAQDEINGAFAAATSQASDDPVASVESSIEAYAALATYVPDDLQDELTTLRGAFDTLHAAMAGVDPSSTAPLSEEQQAAIEAASAAQADPALATAAEAVERYFAAACPGVDFGG